jgi:predicted phage terminase large subunit-like protein
VSDRPDFLSLPDLEPLFAAELARRAQARAHQDREAVLAECATLAGFIKNAWHVLEPGQPYVHSWHIDAVCLHLEAVTDGWIQRLLINIPPGTMKSLLVSVFWPAWEWGPRGLPNMRYLTTSYEEELVNRDNLRMRRLVESEWYQSLWGDAVKRSEKWAVRKFENRAGGGREGRSFISMTGGRGDRVIIDDPHSTKTAESDAERGTTTSIFREAIPTRVNNPDSSAIIVIMQRLHQTDVSGVALELEQGYVHLCLPMEFEPERKCRTRIGPGRFWEDPRTEEGELLFPDRFPRQVVDRDKRAMGIYAVAGQFQQRPTPREGGLFNVGMIEVVAAPPPMTKIVRAWDFASTKKKQAVGGDPDWTAGVQMGRGIDGFFYILDTRRFRETAGKVRATVQATASQDGTGVYVRIPQDPGQAGKDQVANYAQALAGYMLKAVPVSGDKELRATPLAAMVDLGMVKMVRGPWNADFMAEAQLFPAGTHDDQVDAAADAFNELAGIVPGEGLLEFYRQEAERAALDGLGDAPRILTDKRGLVPLYPPPGFTMAFGLSGECYRADPDGRVYVLPEDVGLANAPGWERAPPPDDAGEPGPNDHLQEYLAYIRNTGQVPLPVADFDDDWEPIGPNVRRQLVAAGLAVESAGGIRLTAPLRQ